MRPAPQFHGEVDSQKALSDCVPSSGFSGFPCREYDPETAKNVMGMQHQPTTFSEMVRTPKKAAHACLFCFTIVTLRTRLQTR
jgi:hypothetical protein